MISHSLPKLPPLVESATRAAAEEITAALASVGLSPTEDDGTPSPFLYSILYLLKKRCLEVVDKDWLSKGDELITLTEVATVLETLGQVMVSEDTIELLERNASWYKDAADRVTKAERDLKRQLDAINKLLEKGLGEGVEGRLSYPSKTGSWQVGDTNVDTYLEQYRGQKVLLIVAPMGD